MQEHYPENDSARRQEHDDLPPLSFLELLQSTLWAAIGVQKRENRLRDFSRGKAHHFILMGIGFTFCFVVSMLTLVNLIVA